MVFLLFGAGILAACQVGKVPPVLTGIRNDLGIDLFHAGWVLSIFNVTGLLLGTCTGIISDTIGHRRLLTGGFVLLTTGCILGSVSSNFPTLLAARFVEGTGFLSIIISTPTLIFRVVRQKDLKIALSVWSCYVPAGVALMMILVPVVIRFTDWRGLWQINAATLAAYGVFLFFSIRKIPGSSNRRTKIEPLKMLRNIFLTTTSAGPFLLAFIFIAYSLQWLAVMGFLPTLIVEKYGFSTSKASVLTALMVAVNIIGNLCGGRLLETGIRRWKLIAFAKAVMGLSAVAIYSDSPHFMINYSGCLCFSLFGGLIPASILGGAPVYAPSPKLLGTTNGLVIQGGQSGQVIGPPVLAYLISVTGGWSCGSWFLGSVALIGIMAALLLSRLKPNVS